MLGGDEDGTVGALVTIECRGGGILEDADALHVLGNDVVNAALDTVDEDERCAGGQRLQATHVEGGVGGIVEAGTLQGYESVALAEDVVADVVGPTVVDILIGDDAHGGSRLLTGERPVGTHIDGLRLEVDRVDDFILRHCRQADACKQGEHEYISFLHNHFNYQLSIFFLKDYSQPGFCMRP